MAGGKEGPSRRGQAAFLSDQATPCELRKQNSRAGNAEAIRPDH